MVKKKIINRHYIGYMAGLMLLLSVECWGQSNSQKVVNNSDLGKGNVAYMNLDYMTASQYYEAYLKNNASDTSIRKNLADCYWQMRNYPEALKEYQLLYPNGKGDATPLERFRIGELYARESNYEQASQWLSGMPGFKSKEQAYSNESLISSMQADTAGWTLGMASFNTGYREYCPLIWSESELLFCSNRPLTKSKTLTGWDGDNYSRLWRVGIPEFTIQPVDADSLGNIASLKPKPVTETKNLAGVFEGSEPKRALGTWQSRVEKPAIGGIPKYVGTPVSGFEALKYNVGGIAKDTLGHIYFSANYPNTGNKDGKIRVHLLEGNYDGTRVSNIRELPFGDPNTYSAMHPAVTGDGTTVVFSSDKTGTGNYDLYYAQRASENSQWSEMQPLTLVNTPGNEVFPTITKKGELYFSSDGRAGLGGLDIYHLPLANALKGKGTVLHMSAPVNSPGDDFGWAQDSVVTQAYFTSDRGTSEDNIFSASYAPKPMYPACIEGYVKDRQTMDPMGNIATFMLDPCTNKVYVSRTDVTGKYRFCSLPANCQVSIKAATDHSADCLKMQAVKNMPEKDKAEKAPHDLLLDKFTKGMIWILQPPIHYDFDKWNIRADARPILDSLVRLMQTYPITIELGSHTDSRGTYAYNDRLSQRRAESAVAYIVSKGINPNRITAKGYGERKLLNKCSDGVPCTEAEHQANRRTEITILQGITPTTEQPGFDSSKYRDGQVLDPSEMPAGFFDNCK